MVAWCRIQILLNITFPNNCITFYKAYTLKHKLAIKRNNKEQKETRDRSMKKYKQKEGKTQIYTKNNFEFFFQGYKECLHLTLSLNL